MAVRSVWRAWCRRIARSISARGNAARRPDRGGPRFLKRGCLLSVITVTSLADNLTVDGKVTLREAIKAANTNTRVDGSVAGQAGVQDEIVFKPGLTGTIKLNPALGELFITGSVQIVGLGAKNTVIDAQGNSRVFEVARSAGNVTLSSLTVTGGEDDTRFWPTAAGFCFCLPAS